MKNEKQNKLLWKKKHYKYRNRHKKRGDKMSNEAKKKFEYIRKEVYCFDLYCMNCDYRDVITIPIGMTVKEYKEKNKCLNCGCALK
jgi:hypothetical protein